MTILEYLDVIKTYPMEDYFARYGEIGAGFKTGRRGNTKEPGRNTKKLVTGNCGSSR